MADVGAGANWVPGVIVGLLSPLVIKWLEVRGAARTEATKAKETAQTEQKRIAVEAQKAEDAADAEVLRLLVEDKKEDRKRIAQLEADIITERKRCDEEMRAIRESCEKQIESVRAQMQTLVAEISTLRAENSELKKSIATFR